MSYEIKGKLVFIGSTVNRTDTFKTREFAIETSEQVQDKVYFSYAKFQTVQAKTAALDAYNLGDNITVHFNVKGSKYLMKDGATTGYITNLDAWKIEKADSVQPSGKAYQQTPAPVNSDISPDNDPDGLPF